ncbi:MAG: MBL fold metallo-hydrolase [Chloroflexota bacterium]
MTTRLVLLGTGTPNISATHYQNSFAVIVDEVPYIVDCGAGMLQRAAQSRLSALAMPKLTRLFLTHLHPDHTTGLPDFLIAPWVLDRAETVQIFGCAGTQSLVDLTLQAYETGIAEHRDGLAPIDHPLDIVVTEISAGEIYRDERVTVMAFAASHGTLEAYSYKFVTADKTIVISGDTTPTDAMREHAKDCDILVHEVYSAVQFAQRDPRWQAYHQQAHTSTIELAEIANATQPDLLVLVHQLYWSASDDDLLAEIREAGYTGTVISGSDLDVFQ